MTYDRYKLRLSSYGNTIEDSQVKSTIYNLTQSFKESPSYRQIYINNIATDCRIIDTDKSFEKKLLFMPGISKDIGEVAVIDGDNWLIIDSQSNEMFSKALIKNCNETLRWVDANDVTQEYPCVIAKTTLSSFDENKFIQLLDNKLYLFVSNDENTIIIKPKTRIILGKQVYGIVGMDDVTTSGLIQFNLETVEIDKDDDFLNNIADNEGLYELPTGGGSLW
jgi:hypothetical protein